MKRLNVKLRKNIVANKMKNAKLYQRSKAVCTVFLVSLALMLVPGLSVNASSGASVVTAKFNILIDLVSAIISSIGTLITLWGLGEWGISFQGQDGIMQSHAFKRIGGGLVGMLSPQLLKLFTS